MEKLRVQVNGRGYYLKTDNPEEVLSFAKTFEDRILYITTKMPGISEAEATALSALLIMGDSLKKKRSDEDELLIDELTGKAEILQERIEELERQLLIRSETEAQLKAEAAALEERADELAEQLAGAQEKGKALSEQCSDSETTIADVKSALSSANKIIAQLNTEKLTEVAANEALRNELEAAQGRLETATKTIAELNGRLTKMEIHSSVNEDGTPVPEELKKLREEKEELEIELAIANEEMEKLREAANKPAAASGDLDKTIAEYEKKIRALEARSGEMDKLRAILAETEQSVRQKCDEKDAENDKLRKILKNYESSYGVVMSKKEEEILNLQAEVEQLKERLGAAGEKLNADYVQTTFGS